MQSLTDQLVEAASGILKLQPEVRDETGHYFMFDDGGVEVQSAEFLWGLVRMTQPDNILETGTYTGVSSLYMAQALKENKHGHITTLEVENTHKIRAERLWKVCGVADYVECKLLPSLDYNPTSTTQYDILFLDSEPNVRFSELVRFYPYLKEGGYILIHDLYGHLGQQENKELGWAWPFNPIPQAMMQYLKDDKLRVIPLPAPRGMTLFYKVKDNDYNPNDARFKP